MKHIKGKSVSKGLRRSSIKAGAPKKPAIIVQAERVSTNMREAFLNMKVDVVSVENGKLVDHMAKRGTIANAVLTSAKQNAGNNKVGRGWSCNLSPKTIRQLTEQGVFA